MWLVYILMVIFGSIGFHSLLDHRLKMKKLDVFKDAKRLKPPTDELEEAFKELNREFPNK